MPTGRPRSRPRGVQGCSDPSREDLARDGPQVVPQVGESATGTHSTVRARFSFNHRLSYSAPSYRESSEDGGADVSRFKPGDEVAATKEQFVGALRGIRSGFARMMAPEPRRLDFIQSASVPIVAVTAWQMLFDYAAVTGGRPCSSSGPLETSARRQSNWPSLWPSRNRNRGSRGFGLRANFRRRDNSRLSKETSSRSL